jgi:hypothetical protein
MSIFSPKVKNFLTRIGRIKEMYWAPVPRSSSCGRVGDFLIFRYQLGTGKGSRAQRTVMIVKPVIKCPKTGNLLLSAVKVDLNSISTPSQIENLYKSEYFTEYRTYRMNKMFGQLYRLEEAVKKG